MPLLEPTGPPRIIDGNGNTIDLRYADRNRHMRASYTDESGYTEMFSRVQFLNEPRRLRPTFQFGYLTLETSVAQALIDGLRNSDFVTFIPRTKLAGDPEFAVEKSYTCVVRSNIPFSKKLSRDFSIDLELVSVDPLGSSVVVPTGTLYVLVTEGNDGGPESAAQQTYRDNSIAVVNIDGSVETIADLQGTPVTMTINEGQKAIWVLLDNGAVYKYTLGGQDETFIDLITDPYDLATLEAGPWAGYLFATAEAGGFGDDFVYRYNPDGSNKTLLNPGTDQLFKSPGLHMAPANDKLTIYFENFGAFWSVRRFSGNVLDNGEHVLRDAIINNAWGIVYSPSQNRLYVGQGTGAVIQWAPASLDTQSSGALTTIAIPPIGVTHMTWDDAGSRLFFAGQDLPYWPTGNGVTSYYGPLAADIGNHSIVKVIAIQ